MTCIFGKYVVSVSAFLIAFCAASAVEAGFLADTSEALSPGGPDAGFWRGSEILSESNGFGAISGTVSFAVFAPDGSFDTFLDDSYGDGVYSDPTAGTKFIYAFQVQSDSGNSIETLNSGYDFGANTAGFLAPQSIAGSGDIGPGSTVFNSTSAVWDFSGATIANGQISDVLFYTSDLGPQPDKLSIGSVFGLVQADSGETDFASPSQIPEPTSALLMIIGTALGLLIGRREGHF